MLRLKNEWVLFSLLVSLPFLFNSCTTNRSYSRDYTVNRSARSKAYTYTSKSNSTSRVKPNRSTPPTSSPSSRTKTTRTERQNTSRNSTASSTLSKELTERNRIVSFASKYVGKPYNYGGKTPESGFDCSGLVYYTFRHFDYAINVSSRAQSQQGRKIKLADAAPGDLLFFGHRGQVNHVAIVVHNTDNSLIILHSTSSGGVMKEDYYQSDYWKRRFLFARTYVGVIDGGSMAGR